MDKSTEKLQKLIVVIIVLSLCINFQYLYLQFRDGFVGIGISTQIPMDKLKLSVQTEFRQDIENNDQPIIIDDLTYSMFKDHVNTLPVTYVYIPRPAYSISIAKCNKNANDILIQLNWSG
jgi:hypothetical protein